MKKVLLLTLLFVLLSCFFRFESLAQVNSPAKGTNVSAQVGDFYLSLSGFASPLASIILTSDGVFLRSTVADEDGNFSISNVLIKQGFSSFCLETIDRYRRTSLKCFEVPPAQASIAKHNIFLPPTLGLLKSQVSEREEGVAFGCTLPKAKVTVYISPDGEAGGKTVETTADDSGCYEISIGRLEPGTYKLYATSESSGRVSEKPDRQVELKSLSLPEEAVTTIEEEGRDLLERYSSLWWVLLLIFLIILIFILLTKLWPKLLNRFFFLKALVRTRRKNHLELDWLLDFLANVR